MRDVARDPAALEPLERLQVQRGRLADRMRPPWWYLPGVAILWALVFAVPFTSRFLGVSIWPLFAAALAVACLLQWGVTRATGIKVGFRNLRYPPAGRPVRIAIVVVSVAALVTENLLIDRDLIVAAIVVAAVAVVAEVAAQQAALRGIRQELRGGGGAA
jgi:hypothetical protein